jgi:hypothetical protein
LLFLADNAKTVIYVTQGSGELSLTPNQRSPERSISKLVEKLKQVNCDVRPLVIDAKNPAVPGDASLVLIADPISSLPKPVADAIGIYVLPGDKQSKRGKFILLSGPNPSQDGKSIQTIGFEPQLTSLGIALGKEQIFSDPDRNNMTAMPVVGPSPESNSPIAKEMQGQAVRFFTTRGVEILQGGPPDAQVEPLFVTLAGRRTFVDEPDLRGSSALATWLEIQDNPKVRTAKQYGDQPRIVGVTVKDGKSTQGVIVGSGMAFCDVLNGALNEIFISFIDTLRERPSVSSLATKQYGLYTPPPLENYSRAFWLPVLLIPLTLAAIGAGVWVVRRR